MRRLRLLTVVALVVAGLAVPGASAGSARSGGPLTGHRTTVQKAAMLRGALPKDAARLAEGKAAAAKAAPATTGTLDFEAAPAPRDPVVGVQFEGVKDEDVAPPDTTGAAGPTRYVELVNQRFGIYDRSGTLLDQGTLWELSGRPLSEDVFDPQVIWDPGTQRFYYAMDDIVSSSDNRIAFGWSTTASPSSDADWCKYSDGFGYGSSFPDYPKLGDSADFLLIGVNTFGPFGFFVGSDVIWVGKPPAGTTCPSQASLTRGVTKNLRDSDGSQTFTPIPANQTDDSGTGWIAAADPYVSGQANQLSLFTVTKDGTGNAVIQTTGTPVGVPNYTFPAPAPQRNTSVTLDTLDGRLTQAVSAIYPPLNKPVIWTQHAIAGGAGSQVRMYGIDPQVPQRMVQNLSHPSVYVFNAAVSPDRRHDGTTGTFGEWAVVGVSTSSSNTFPAVYMVSKHGLDPISAPVLIVQSQGFNRDFTCSPCRYGDYSGATPDPASSTSGTRGVVWLANQWNDPSATNQDTDWRTWVWAATP